MHRAATAFVACRGTTSASPTPTRTVAQAEPPEGGVRTSPTQVRARRISEFVIGEAVEGRVAFKGGRNLVWVDIGSFGNALLVGPPRLTSKLKPNEILKDLYVEEADAEARRLVVKFQNAEKVLEERKSDEFALPGVVDQATPRPLSDFSVGDVVDGRVVFKKDGLGVFLDIGAVKEALLLAPYSRAMELRPKATLRGLRVKEVDPERRRLAVNLPDQVSFKPISAFSEGDLVNGRVAFRIKDVGVMVDVGAEKNALLLAPYNGTRYLKQNDILEGLRVKDTDPETGHLSVTLPDRKVPKSRRSRTPTKLFGEVRVSRPLSSFSVDDEVDGWVVHKHPGRVLVDVGARKRARLVAPDKVAMRLKPRAILRGLRVQEVDLERGLLAVTLPPRYMPKKSLSKFSVDDVVDGRVAVKKFGVGVFVDIGAENTALLRAPYELAMKLELDETLPGLRVQNVELERGKIAVTFPDLEVWIREREENSTVSSKATESDTISSEAIDSVAHASDVPPKMPAFQDKQPTHIAGQVGDWIEELPPEAGPKPLADFSVGDVVDGRVAFKKAGVGVFLDIGAVRSALLLGPYLLAMRLQPNETLQGLRLEEVDLDKGRMAVTFPPGLEARYKPASEFSVGDILDGEVAFRKGGVGVFVDVGAVKNAELSAPRKLAMKLKPKEALKGLRVEKVDLEEELVTLTYPHLERHVRGRP